jgi:hypothetical protein
MTAAVYSTSLVVVKFLLVSGLVVALVATVADDEIRGTVILVVVLICWTQADKSWWIYEMV